MSPSLRESLTEADELGELDGPLSLVRHPCGRGSGFNHSVLALCLLVKEEDGEEDDETRKQC